MDCNCINKILDPFVRQGIKGTEIISFVAIIIALLAYLWTVNKEYERWKSLLKTFKFDLGAQKDWLDGKGYNKNYKDKRSYSPYKRIYPLSFISLSAILEKGLAEIDWMDESFLKNLSLFNERVLAFNSLLEESKITVNSKPILSKKLEKILCDCGMRDDCVNYDEFINNLENIKNHDCYELAMHIRKLNENIHITMINNNNREDYLNYLFKTINQDLKKNLQDFDENKPWFIRYRKFIIIILILIFILLYPFF